MLSTGWRRPPPHGGREARAHALGLGRARVEHGDAREVKEEEREQQLHRVGGDRYTVCC